MSNLPIELTFVSFVSNLPIELTFVSNLPGTYIILAHLFVLIAPHLHLD